MEDIKQGVEQCKHKYNVFGFEFGAIQHKWSPWKQLRYTKDDKLSHFQGRQCRQCGLIQTELI